MTVAPLKVTDGFFKSISAAELEQLTSELSILLRNGVQLDRALEMMAQANPNATIAALLADLTEQVRAGTPLHKAFSCYSRYFDNLYCEMVRIGEESGKLAETLQRLTQNLKFQNELRSKVTQALVYPGFIMAVCLVSLFAIFNFIVPSMEGLFSNRDDLPAYTAFLLSSSAFVRENQMLIIGSFVVFVFFVLSSSRKPWFRSMMLAVAAKTPVIRSGLLLSERIRFVSAMQLMLQSGLPLSQSLHFAQGVFVSPAMGLQVRRVKDDIAHGQMLSQSLASTELLEPVMMSLIKVGEESGNLETVFAEINNRARWRFEQWALKLTSMLEPLLIIIMGGLVGSVVVTMLLSIVSTSDVPI
ncbi:type II secretion system F family protein [Rheinheimera maricola]|uniref:Type II secretion system F family protein n=1 Tax=Rheinheimera maricola TaxID=2793282 RepID=A0ABS7X3Z8_9GAMM|nr:type II secretion system F family protein [Rheinheimera maricola]MBZ9610283.1 type II secretion system F family protein [Rheinheimera maricola]